MSDYADKLAAETFPELLLAHDVDFEHEFFRAGFDWNAMERAKCYIAIRKALEDAAQIAESLECGDPTPRCTIAKRIRAMKGGK